jgi:hypothetical protein
MKDNRDFRRFFHFHYRHIIHCQQRFPMETIFLFDKRGPTMSMTCVDSCNILTNFKLFTMCKFEKEKILNINFTQTMRNFTVNSNIKRERRFQVFFWNWQSIQDFVTVQTKPSFVPASTNNSVSGERILRILFYPFICRTFDERIWATGRQHLILTSLKTVDIDCSIKKKKRMDHKTCENSHYIVVELFRRRWKIEWKNCIS